MSCCGNHGVGKGPIDRPPVKKPSTPCVLCGEKHLATARAFWLEAMASGYTLENHASIIGELNAASWHVWRFDYHLAEIIRDIRHLVQARREEEIDFLPALERMDILVKFELGDPSAIPPPSTRGASASQPPIVS